MKDRDEKLFSPKEVAELGLLRIANQSKERRSGRLKCYRRGRRIVYSQAQLDAYLALADAVGRRARQVRFPRNWMNSHAFALLRLIVVLGFIAGLSFASIGIWLVYVGAVGETRISFFGATGKSANVGIVAVIVGAGLIWLSFRGVLRKLRGVGLAS